MHTSTWIRKCLHAIGLARPGEGGAAWPSPGLAFARFGPGSPTWQGECSPYCENVRTSVLIRSLSRIELEGDYHSAQTCANAHLPWNPMSAGCGLDFICPHLTSPQAARARAHDTETFHRLVSLPTTSALMSTLCELSWITSPSLSIPRFQTIELLASCANQSKDQPLAPEEEIGRGVRQAIPHTRIPHWRGTE